MKKYLLLLPTLFLGGCFYQTADYLDLAAAERVCYDKGGVKYLIEFFNGKTGVRCFVGAGIETIDSIVVEIENERNRK